MLVLVDPLREAEVLAVERRERSRSLTDNAKWLRTLTLAMIATGERDTCPLPGVNLGRGLPTRPRSGGAV